jgi:protein-disulfide isomerase-like protein with CxxC motif
MVLNPESGLRDLAESTAELRELADGHDEVVAQAAGITAGSWYASPATHVGYELVAAGMLIMAAGHDGKPLNYDALERWTRAGYEQGMRFRKGER